MPNPHLSTPPAFSRLSLLKPTFDRRGRLYIRRVDAWSVLKFSLIFYFCLMLVGLLVVAMLWVVLARLNVFGELTKFAGNFSLDLKFSAGSVFRYYLLLGLLGVVLWSVATVLLTLLFNLVNDITGGIEVIIGASDDEAT